MKTAENVGRVPRQGPPSAALGMNRTRALFATLAVLLLGGCGAPDPKPMPFGCWSVAPSSLAPGQALAANATKSDEAWAASAFARYGEAAVETCLQAFRQEADHGAVDVDTRGEPTRDRAHLAAFMCACARGQSAEACPNPAD